MSVVLFPGVVNLQLILVSVMCAGRRKKGFQGLLILSPWHEPVLE
jgi:hypothetical protein